MNILRLIAGGGALLAALLLVTTLVASAWLVSRAERVQRIVPHDEATATLLGEVGTPVGRPDDYIIFHRGAFTGETTDEGAQLVSEPFLEENNVYPWQLKTVIFLRNLISAVSLAAFVLLGGVWFWLWQRGKDTEAREQDVGDVYG